MAVNSLIGRDALIKRWRSYLQRFKKKSKSPFLLVNVRGPEGVGRTGLVDFFKKDLEKGGVLWEFSLLEGPILPQLYRAASSQRKGLEEAWAQTLKAKGRKKRAYFIFRDYQEIEENEKRPMENFFRFLAELGHPVLILREAKDDVPSEKLNLPASRVKNLSIKPLGFNKVSTWFHGFTKEKRVSPKVAKKFFKQVKGLPREMVLWGNFLKEHVKNFTEPESLPNWPANREDLLDRAMGELEEEPRAILQVWGLHPSWMTTRLLAQVLAYSQSKVRSYLKSFSKWGWIEASLSRPSRYLLKENGLGERAIELLDSEKKQKMHRALFEFFQHQSKWVYLETWLAFHASQGELTRRAFAWNILAGESYEQKGDIETALAYFQYALEFARDDFQKSYLLGILGETCFHQKRFREALSNLIEAEKLAESIPWPEFLQNFGVSLGQLLCHLGRFRQAEPFFQKALKAISSRKLEEDRIKTLSILGLTYLEQARYGEAFKIFEELKAHYSETKDVLGLMGAEMSLIQTYIALGQVRQALELMEDTQERFKELPVHLWEPLFKLLMAKLYSTQGRLGMALRVLEEAAAGFEAAGDLPGKVEVLLAMSAPMLEYNLIDQAQRIMELLGDWTELRDYPALQHSIQLRRMAVSAFSGKWVKEDFSLAGQSSLHVGRIEDWLLFWFHLALASQRLEDPKFFTYFIEKARDLAQTIAKQLDPENAKSFLQRPDVARIFRLSKEKKIGEVAPVLAERQTEAAGPAEAATLARPIPGPGTQKD